MQKLRAMSDLEIGGLLVYLATAITRVYKNDPSSPCIAISKLPEGRFYVAVHRFLKEYGEDKKVVLSVTDVSLTRALKGLAFQWWRAAAADGAASPRQE